MTTGPVIAKGIIHGKTIELDQEPGIPEGQVVSVILKLALPPGEGLRQSFGAWGDDSEGLDEFVIPGGYGYRIRVPAW